MSGNWIESSGSAFSAGDSFQLTVHETMGTIVRRQWFFNGLALVDGGRIAGVTEAVLTVVESAPLDSGAYGCRLAFDDGTTEWLTPVAISVAPSCGVDSGGTVLAAGSLGTALLTVSTLTGDREWFPDTLSVFEVGRPVFVSDADGGQVAYVGLAVSVGASLITSRPTATDRSVGARLWSPAQFVALPLGQVDPVVTPDAGIVAVACMDGQFRPVQIREPSARVACSYPWLAGAAYEELLAFLKHEAGAKGGLNDFILTDWDATASRHRLATVRLSGGLPAWRSSAPGHGSVNLEFFILADGAYSTD